MTAEPWYADKQVFIAELAKHETFAGLSRAHGTAPQTIKRWADTHGVAAPKKVNFNADAPSRADLLEHENAELKAALNQARNAAVRDQRLLEHLKATVPGLEPIYKPLKPTKSDPAFTEHTFVLMWSDLHAGEQVFKEQMGGVNEYDWSIMMQRHDRIIDAITSFKENRPYPVKKLVIAGLGDMVTGDIHDELKITNEMVIMETALQLGIDGAKFIERLVPLFEEIEFHGIVGNHGRMSKKPTAKNQHDNFDWMVYNLLDICLVNYPSVKVNVPTAAYTWFKVYNSQCFMLHGDGIPTNMPGIPWGGVQRRTRELERQFEPVIGQIDHFMLGHFHQANVVDNKRIIVNGSVKGPDEYSIKRYGSGSPATQLMHTFHPVRGLTETCYLDLG